ncbi:MAG: tellurite resistance TerB family protein [Gammaproteobacteria bacterium]|jgi:uncharacterized membrane protein YebE (DUF533 family)
MVDLNNVVQGLSKSGAVSGFAGGLAGTALAGALSGKKGKKMAKSALKVGALAAVGGLAYTAYQRYRQNDQQARGPAPSAVHAGPGAGDIPGTPHSLPRPAYHRTDPVQRWNNIHREQFESVIAHSDGATSGSMLLIRAMIAAAAADGHMDQGEQDRIFDETRRMDLAAEDKAVLFDELRNPLSLEQLVSQVPNPETGLEVYAASLVAIDETRQEGRDYLRRLAAALELPSTLVTSLHAHAEFARQDQAA